MMREDRRIEELTVIGVTAILLLLLTVTIEKTTLESINQITGEVLSTVNVTPLIADPCNFTLEQGLNLVSFFCITYDTSRAEVIGNLTNMKAIFEYQENRTDSWKTYNPSLPSWVVQDLEHMSRTEGYWIDMTGQEQILVSGGLRRPTNVPLVKGWNLAGYPTNATKPVNVSFLTIDGNFTEVRAFNATTQTFISYIPPSGGGLQYTSKYEGYWINATENEVWIVD